MLARVAERLLDNPVGRRLRGGGDGVVGHGGQAPVDVLARGARLVGLERPAVFAGRQQVQGQGRCRQAGAQMIGIVALEAHRAGAVVVGEDLGTVEPWVRDYLRDRGLLGTSILWFEFDFHGDGSPLAPESFDYVYRDVKERVAAAKVYCTEAAQAAAKPWFTVLKAAQVVSILVNTLQVPTLMPQLILCAMAWYNLNAVAPKPNQAWRRNGTFLKMAKPIPSICAKA